MSKEFLPDEYEYEFNADLIDTITISILIISIIFELQIFDGITVKNGKKDSNVNDVVLKTVANETIDMLVFCILCIFCVRFSF